MSSDERPTLRWRRLVRNPRNLVGGLLLAALGVVALLLSRDLDPGTLREMGPGMMPRWLAGGVALCGLFLVAAAFLRERDPMDEDHAAVALPLRGPLLVVLAILVFAATIRPLHLGSVQMPGLGLAIGGPLTLVLAGYATPEARLRELIALAFGLTAFCLLLFGDLLNQPIPIMPRALADLFPDAWSEHMILRVTAAGLAAVAALAYLANRRSGERAEDSGNG